MKSKAPLAMMEQMVMILVFALAAALCLQAFVKSDQMSRDSEERDRALQAAQSAAEAVQHTAGDFVQAAELLNATVWGEDDLTIHYSEDWAAYTFNPDHTLPFGYTLGVYREESDVPGLGRANVWVQEDETGEELVRFEVCWQEVSAHG